MSGITDSVVTGLLGNNPVTTSAPSITTSAPSITTSAPSGIALNDIVNNEYNRINRKKRDIDDEYTTQKRLLGFNNSFNERYSYYTHMLYVTIIALVIFIVLTVLGSVFPIPSIIIEILVIILICGAGGILLNDYYIINSRNNMNFSELELPSLIDLSKNSIVTASDDTKHSLVGNPDMATCVGESCCSERGTTWSVIERKCVPGNPATPTTIPPTIPPAIPPASIPTSIPTSLPTSVPGSVSSFNTMSGSINESFETMPNSAFEFSNYSKY